MNDDEREKTIKEIREAKIEVYWGEAGLQSTHPEALEALKRFETKVREEEDLSILNPGTNPYEDDHS